MIFKKKYRVITFKWRSYVVTLSTEFVQLHILINKETTFVC